MRAKEIEKADILSAAVSENYARHLVIVGILCGLEACFIVECAVGIYGIVVVADVFVCEKRIGRAVRGADISLSINERGRSRNAVIIRLLYRLGYAADYDLIALVIVARNAVYEVIQRKPRGIRGRLVAVRRR